MKHIALLLSLLFASSAQARDLTIFAAASLKEPLDQLLQTQPGVTATYGGSGTLAPGQSARLALQRLFPVLAGRIQCQVARVPVFFGQSVAFSWFGDGPVGVDQALARFAGAGLGVAELDEMQRGQPLSADLDSDNLRIHELAGSDDGMGLGLWVSADNVRYGAALKGVQIVELLIKDYL